MITVEQLRDEARARYVAEGGIEHDCRETNCDRLHYLFRFGMGPNMPADVRREDIAERIAERIARVQR